MRLDMQYDSQEQDYDYSDDEVLGKKVGNVAVTIQLKIRD